MVWFTCAGAHLLSTVVTSVSRHGGMLAAASRHTGITASHLWPAAPGGSLINALAPPDTGQRVPNFYLIDTIACTGRLRLLRLPARQPASCKPRHRVTPRPLAWRLPANSTRWGPGVVECSGHKHLSTIGAPAPLRTPCICVAAGRPQPVPAPGSSDQPARPNGLGMAF